MLTHKIQLPEAFGTATIHGMFYEIARANGGATEKIMEEMLKVPFLFSIGFRSPKELAFIASEAEDFISWSKRNYNIEPRLTFV